MTIPFPDPHAEADTDRPGDADLIRLARTGDNVAFTELYRRHVDAANRLARGLSTDPVRADDLVSEAFTRVLSRLRAGHGPDVAFRAYLLTSLRNTFYDQVRADRRLEVTDDLAAYDRGEEFTDTAAQDLERSLAARAFGRLPERWQVVLWHTEVERESPARVAPLLGLSPNGVSALAYRARERLRQLYLQEHIADTAEPDCRWAAERLGARVREGLSRRDRQKVDDHLAGCRRCTAFYAELGQLNSSLGGILAPVVVGSTWVTYLGLGGTAKSATVLGGTGLVATCQHAWHAALLWLKQLWARIGPRNAALGGGAVIAAAVVAGLLLMSSSTPPPQHPPRAAGPTTAARPPGNPPQQAPDEPPARQAPGAQPPADRPADHPSPARHRRRHPPDNPPATSVPTPPYRITPPTLTVGTLTAGEDGTLPITVSNPGPDSGGAGGGAGADPVALPRVPVAGPPVAHDIPHPRPGPPVPSTGTRRPDVESPPATTDPATPSPTGTPSRPDVPTGTPTPGGTPSATPAVPGTITLTVTLPTPMRLRDTARTGDGWRCRAVEHGARCRHAALSPGAKAVATLHVDVGDLAGFQPVEVALGTAGHTHHTRFDVVVAPAGTSTRYAANGAVTVAGTGASFGWCLPTGHCADGICRPGHDHGLPWPCPAASATLRLPAGATVDYASLTWSAAGYGDGDTVRVRAPDSATVHEVTGDGLGGGTHTARVTDLVRAGGSGSWCVGLDGGSPLTSGRWGLLVVVDVPGAAEHTVAVFSGRAADPSTLRVADAGGTAEVLALDGPSGRASARLDGHAGGHSGTVADATGTVGRDAHAEVRGGPAGLAVAGPR